MAGSKVAGEILSEISPAIQVTCFASILDVQWGSEQNELRTRNSTPNHSTIILVVVVGTWIDVRAVEVQIVGVVTIVRRRGPIVPVRATIVHRRAVNVA